MTHRLANQIGFSQNKIPGCRWVQCNGTHQTSALFPFLPDLLAGRGLQPRPQCSVSPRQHKFRTGLQTPSGNLSLMHMGVHGHSFPFSRMTGGGTPNFFNLPSPSIDLHHSFSWRPYPFAMLSQISDHPTLHHPDSSQAYPSSCPPLIQPVPEAQ